MSKIAPFSTPHRRAFTAPIFACVLLLLHAMGAVVHAHSVWIEDLPDGRLVVRFGEPSGDVEKSPGYLYQLTSVTAWTHVDGKPKSFAVSKQSDHFLIDRAGPNAVVQIETGFPVRKMGDKPA